MASGKSKSIDTMNMVEMFQTMQALDVSFEGVEDLNEMRLRVRAVLNQSDKTSSWSAGQAFSVLSDAKEEDARKREKLLDFYIKFKTFLGKMDKQMMTLLQKHTHNVNENMERHIKQLNQKQYFLLVAGETSSGKSSLINLILGEEILPHSLLSTTSTICELKFGEQRRLVVHFKNKDPEPGSQTKEILLEQPTGSSEKGYIDQISPYVHAKTDREKASNVKKIELFWPHSVLQAGLVIIDSPGVGESDEMDQMVIQYLPEAFAFIYVINSSNAGGVQKDRLEKLLQRARNVSLGVSAERKDEGGLSLNMQEHLFSKCALFVCNKWDIVMQQEEVQSVKDDVIKKLKKVWPGLDPESQIIYMSATRASIAQNLGFISKDFFSLTDGMRSMVLNSIEAKLELHWNWLYTCLSRIVVQAKAFVKNPFRSNQEISQIIGCLEEIEKHQKKVIEALHEYFNKHVDSVVQQLAEHLSSEDVKARFTSWSPDEVPDEYGSWKDAEEKITTVLSSRFQEVVEEWEEENKVFADVRLSLMRKIQDCYDGVEFELQNLQNEATADSQGGIGNSGKKTFRFRFSTARKAMIEMRNFTLGVLFIIADYIDEKFDSEVLGNSLESFCNFANVAFSQFGHLLPQVSLDFLTARKKNKELRKFVLDKLKDAKLFLDQIDVCLPAMIKADRELYEQLLKETELSKEKAKPNKSCQLILDEGTRHRDQLALFGITEVCAVKINNKELDWKENDSSRLGRGAFGAVYQGTLIRDGDVTTVALKVWDDPFGAYNASDIMEEMKILRELKHPYIVQFYGISLDMNAFKMILIMEKCKTNLKNHIFRKRDSVPGRSEDPAIFQEIFLWAEQITDGLAFIHKMDVVHRDLKLENILLSEENTVKIADVGLAKAEIDITGTLTGTPLYMAPEVFDSQVYDTKADIYSLGLIMWEMWYRKEAFADVPIKWLEDLRNWVCQGNRPGAIEGYKTPPSFWELLMTECWDKKPKIRPTAKQCNERINMGRKSQTTGTPV